MGQVSDLFSQATTAVYNLRNASDTRQTYHRGLAGAAVRAYAEAAGIDVVDAMTAVCDWVDSAFPADEFPNTGAA